MGRFSRVLIVLAAVAGACASPESGRELPADVLFVPTSGGIDVVSAARGDITATIPGGVASPDFSVLASTERRGDSTVVRRLDPAGNVLGRTTIAGDVTARVVSGSGELVALTGPRSAGSTPYVPDGRSTTRVVVVGGSQEPRDYKLEGNFEPEAFSTNDRELFLLEYIPAQAPTRYRVRRLRLARGKVLPIGRLKAAAPDQMQGTGRTHTYSPDGTELYTLYTQQHEEGHESGGFAGEHAFVHLLNLKGSWTHCIDLPDTFGAGHATASAMAVDPDGSRLFVLDWSNGEVAVVRPGKLKVERSISVDFGSTDDETFAQATTSRLYVAGGSEVVVLDATDLRVIDRWPMDNEVTGLTLSDDGSRLYVSASQEILLIDAATGDTLRDIAASEAAGLAHVETQPGRSSLLRRR